MTDVFGSETNELVDPIVYVKQKFKKDDSDEIDIEKLAKAKLESDLHISRLEKEQAELRGEVNTRIGLEEFLTKMNTPPQNENTQTKPGNQPPPNETTPVDIERLVSEQLNKADQARTAKANRDRVNDAVVKAWGNDASRNLALVSSQLNMTKEELAGLAERSPDAFFRLTGVTTDSVTPSTGSVPNSTVRLGNEQPTERTEKYYQALKKSNPSLYFSAKVQMQMHDDANRLGAERFFNT